MSILLMWAIRSIILLNITSKSSDVWGYPCIEISTELIVQYVLETLQSLTSSVSSSFPQNLIWPSFPRTTSRHTLGSRWHRCDRWPSAPRCFSMPVICTAPASATAHLRSSLWTAPHTTHPPPTPTTASPVRRYRQSTQYTVCKDVRHCFYKILSTFEVTFATEN